MQDFSAVSKQRMTIKTTHIKLKSEKKGGGSGQRGVNVDTHSTDWLLHLQGVEGLWITVQVKIRQQNQAVHTSSHNNQYIIMPVLYIQDLTQLDGFKQYG